MPFISPNEAPDLVTHSLPLGPSVTYGMRSFIAGGALAVNRSGGSQIRSVWQAGEVTEYFIRMCSVRPCITMTRAETVRAWKLRLSAKGRSAGGTTKREKATV